MGHVTTYEWEDDAGTLVATGSVAKLSLAAGTHTFMLRVQNGTPADTDTDTVVVTVPSGGGGGGKKGGGGGNDGGGGKPCNPKKETCA